MRSWRSAFLPSFAGSHRNHELDHGAARCPVESCVGPPGPGIGISAGGRAIADGDAEGWGPAVAVVAVLVVFYFLNWIPPVPLSLKLGGIYHQVEKADGLYHLTFEKPAWYQVMKRSDHSFHGEGPAYCFTAVFAPVDLKTTIYHRWQYRMATPGQLSGKGEFSTADRIPIRISGGREGGYRGYTIKQHVPPGNGGWTSKRKMVG